MHPVGLPGGGTGSLLLMPAWVDGDVVGVKTVTYVPSNAGTAVPTVNAVYVLFDASGGYHACGLRADGTIVCWGSNNHGQTDAPDGFFSAVSAGNYFSCGLRTDGTITCWGSLSNVRWEPGMIGSFLND